MNSVTIVYGLVAGLAIALLIAAITDIRRRQIDNWLNATVALAAPLFWWASGLSLWPDIALQLGITIVTFAVLTGLFALRAMGGGDVKLLTALALWLPWTLFLKLLLIMALAGSSSWAASGPNDTTSPWGRRGTARSIADHATS